MEALKSVLLVIVVAVALSVGGLVVVGGNDGHWAYDGICRVDRPVEEVFEWLTKPDRRRQWTGASSVAWDGAGRVNTGSRMREIFEDEGRTLDWDVTEAEYARSLTMFTDGDGYEYRIRFFMKPNLSSRRTVINYRVEVQYEGWWLHLTEPFRTRGVEKRLVEDFERLKSAAERS